MSKENDTSDKNKAMQYEPLLGVVPMSDYPDESANWHWDVEWSESDKVCPKCKDVRMWTAGWYDGTPEDGGACIGTKHQCGKCNHYESW